MHQRAELVSFAEGECKRVVGRVLHKRYFHTVFEGVFAGDVQTDRVVVKYPVADAEAQAVLRLGGLPGVMPVLAMCALEAGGDEVAMVMPALRTLRAVVMCCLPSLQERCVWATALARAVARMHRRRVIHRDVKPSNIFLVDREPVIGDFGWAVVDYTGGSYNCDGITPMFASQNARDLGTPTPDDDFESLCYTISWCGGWKDWRAPPSLADLAADPAVQIVMHVWQSKRRRSRRSRPKSQQE